jgi:hypothetical protein
VHDPSCKQILNSTFAQRPNTANMFEAVNVRTSVSIYEFAGFDLVS